MIGLITKTMRRDAAGKADRCTFGMLPAQTLYNKGDKRGFRERCDRSYQVSFHRITRSSGPPGVSGSQRAWNPTAEESSPCPIKPIASDTLNGHNQLVIELVESDNANVNTRDRDPLAKQGHRDESSAYDQVAASVMRLLANASTTLAGIKVWKKLWPAARVRLHDWDDRENSESQQNLAEAIAEVREMAGGRNDILAEAAASQQVRGTPTRRSCRH
jgi:hypothetical protein